MARKKQSIASYFVVIMALAISFLFFGDEPVETDFSQASTLKLPEVAIVDFVRVVDGDTIKVSQNGEEFTVRLIGVDTPETKHPRKGLECFGKEATAFTERLMTDKLRLESDDSQSDNDKYGRTLRYVYNDNGVLVNEELIAKGHAHEYTYGDPYILQRQFIEAEISARVSETGFWEPGACDES